MDKVKLNREDIIPGKPMPWNIYRSNGSTLLNKGCGSPQKKPLLILL